MSRAKLKKLLAESGDTRDDLHCYWRGPWIAQYLMWKRLDWLMKLVRKVPGASVLDLGGGVGTFLPQLEAEFPHVTLLDQDTEIAQKVISHLKLNHCWVLTGNVQAIEQQPRYDVVIAAAFLEHFVYVEVIVDIIKKILTPGGYLIVDLPTENWAYRLGRAIGHIEKPSDHYQTAYTVRRALLKYFELVEENFKPWPFNLYYQAIFRRVSWKQ